MVERAQRRKIVGQFHKRASGALELIQLTTIDRESATGYDVDLSKRYGYIFNESSSGCARPVVVDGIYYASRGVLIKEEPNRLVNSVARLRNKTRRIARMPAKFRCDGGDLLDWLERNGIQQDPVWCDECRDYVAGDDLCEHCWWCNEIGWYSTPGDPCGCVSPKDGDHE